jgi:AcrR family transcriptional regulator
MMTQLKTKSHARGRVRDPEGTRQTLVECAFEEIYEHGYAGASLDRILAKTDLTKGALYHHFKSKADLAHAVIDDVIRGMVVDGWITPLKDSQDPVQALIDTGREIMTTMPPEHMERGCPLNNLTQELSNSDERFREHLAEVFDVWRLGIAEAFERGQALGKVRCDIDPVASATFFVAAIEGLTGLAKASHDRELALSAGMVLLQFLESLKLPPAGGREPAAA